MNTVYIVANWKMNPDTAAEAQRLFDAVAKGVENIGGVEVVICPPFVYLSAINSLNSLRAHNRQSAIKLGAQDCFWKKEGAYTGEISPVMLKDLGCSYIIIGHSERKNYLGETFEAIHKKLKEALECGLTPVVCIGEKERGDSKEEIEKQMRTILKDISLEEAPRVVLAYEPEWAISSNKNAQAAHPEDCAGSIQYMADISKELFKDIEIPILYGGSTNSKNIEGFIEAGASGALVGGASLKAEEFISLVKNAAV
jgi:triosephosphate isomerase (TIM)